MGLQLSDFGFLTQKNGLLVKTEHGKRVPVATDASGKRWQKVADRTPGRNAADKADEQLRLADAGAVYVDNLMPAIRGWWQPVNEAAPSAIAAPVKPAAPAAGEAGA